MAQLSEAFTDLFILAANLRNSGEYGDPDILRRRIINMFEAADQNGRGSGISDDVLRHARYALAAFLDETIMGSTWSQKDHWSSKTLQYEFFKEDVAGVEFFNRLDTIRRSPTPDLNVLEIYYLCLIMGFEGQYKLHGRDQLKVLVDELSRHFPGKPGEMSSLSPHGKRPEEFIEVVKGQLPSWVVVVICVSVIFFFYLVLSFMIGHDVSVVAENLKEILEVGQ